VIRLRWLMAVGILLVLVGWALRSLTADVLQAAEAAFNRGDYSRAAELYGLALREGEDPGHAVFNRGVALYHLGQDDPAADDFRSAQSTGEALRQRRACYERGNCKLRQACQSSQTQPVSLLEEAIQEYESCLAKDQDLPSALATDARHNLELARKLLAQQPRRTGQKQDQTAAANNASDSAGQPSAGAADGNQQSGGPGGAGEKELASAQGSHDAHEAANADSAEGSKGVDPLFREDSTPSSGAQPDQTAEDRVAQADRASQPSEAKSAPKKEGSREKSAGKEQTLARAEDNSQKQNTNKDSQKEPEEQCPT